MIMPVTAYIEIFYWQTMEASNDKNKIIDSTFFSAGNKIEQELDSECF